jgi:hypothetical protein
VATHERMGPSSWATVGGAMVALGGLLMWGGAEAQKPKRFEVTGNLPSTTGLVIAALGGAIVLAAVAIPVARWAWPRLPFVKAWQRAKAEVIKASTPPRPGALAEKDSMYRSKMVVSPMHVPPGYMPGDAIPRVEWERQNDVRRRLAEWDVSVQSLQVQGRDCVEIYAWNNHANAVQRLEVLVRRTGEKDWLKKKVYEDIGVDPEQETVRERVLYPCWFPDVPKERRDLEDGRYEVKVTGWKSDPGGIGVEGHRVILKEFAFTWPACDLEFLDDRPYTTLPGGEWNSRVEFVVPSPKYPGFYALVAKLYGPSGQPAEGTVTASLRRGDETLREEPVQFETRHLQHNELPHYRMSLRSPFRPEEVLDDGFYELRWTESYALGRRELTPPHSFEIRQGGVVGD